MLKLKNIVKIYGEGETTVKALKGVSLNFRKSEFVAILGPVVRAGSSGVLVRSWAGVSAYRPAGACG